MVAGKAVLKVPAAGMQLGFERLKQIQHVNATVAAAQQVM